MNCQWVSAYYKIMHKKTKYKYYHGNKHFHIPLKHCSNTIRIRFNFKIDLCKIIQTLHDIHYYYINLILWVCLRIKGNLTDLWQFSGSYGGYVGWLHQKALIERIRNIGPSDPRKKNIYRISEDAGRSTNNVAPKWLDW